MLNDTGICISRMKGCENDYMHIKVPLQSYIKHHFGLSISCHILIIYLECSICSGIYQVYDRNNLIYTNKIWEIIFQVDGHAAAAEKKSIIVHSAHCFYDPKISQIISWHQNR
jgi:hypothetical protein